MKFSFVEDKDRAEIVVYAPSRTPLVDKIEQIANTKVSTVNAYDGNEVKIIDVGEVECFSVMNSRVIAVTRGGGKYRIKERIYELEETLPSDDFIKINKSAIANIGAIRGFSSTYSGGVNVTFVCGYVEYVSRRQLQNLKRRLNVK